MIPQINLFNPALKKKRPLLTAATMAAAVGAVVAAMAAYGHVLGERLAAAEKQAADSAAALTALREDMMKQAAAARREPSRMLADEVARLDAKVNERRQMAARLQGAGLGSTEGFSRYLASLARQHTEGVWLTAVSVSGASEGIFVRGRALSADLLPGYIQRLNRETALQGKTISELQLSERSDAKVADAARIAKAGTRTDVPTGPAQYIEFSLGSRPAANTDG